MMIYHFWRNGRRVKPAEPGEYNLRVRDVREDWRGRMLIDVEIVP